MRRAAIRGQIRRRQVMIEMNHIGRVNVEIFRRPEAVQAVIILLDSDYLSESTISHVVSVQR